MKTSTFLSIMWLAKTLAAPRASLTLPLCSPNYPRASRIGWTHARRLLKVLCHVVLVRSTRLNDCVAYVSRHASTKQQMYGGDVFPPGITCVPAQLGRNSESAVKKRKKNFNDKNSGEDFFKKLLFKFIILGFKLAC